MANINDELNKTEENLKDTEKAVESLGDKIKEIFGDSFDLSVISERLGINIEKIKEYQNIYNSLKNVKGEGTQKQLKELEQFKQLSEEIKRNLQEAFSKNPEGYINMLQRTTGGRENALNLLKSAGINTDFTQKMNNGLEETKDNLEDVEYNASEAAKAIRDLMSVGTNTGAKSVTKTNDVAKQLKEENKNAQEIYRITGRWHTFDVSEETFKRIETIDKLNDMFIKMVPKYQSSLYRGQITYKPVAADDASEDDLLRNDKWTKGSLINAEEHFKEWIPIILKSTLGNRKEILNSINSIIENEDTQFAKELSEILENNSEDINKQIQRQTNNIFSDDDIKKIRAIARKKIDPDDYETSKRLEWIKHANPYDIIRNYGHKFSIDEYKSVQDMFSGDTEAFDKINKIINKGEIGSVVKPIDDNVQNDIKKQVEEVTGEYLDKVAEKLQKHDAVDPGHEWLHDEHARNLANILGRYGKDFFEELGEDYDDIDTILQEIVPYLDTLENVIDEKNGKVVESYIKKGGYSRYLDKMGKYVRPYDFLREVQGYKRIDELGNVISDSNINGQDNIKKQAEEVKEQVNEVKDTINVLAEDANIAGAKVSESFDDISSSADDTYDSIDELLGITREQSRDAIKGIEELDDSFGVLSDEVKNIGYVDLSDLEFASVDTDKLKELQDMDNLIQKKKEQLSLEQRIQGYNRYASSQRDNVLKEEESIRSSIQSENTKTSYYKQAQAEREKILREEQSVRSKLEKQAQAEAEQTLKKTEDKVKEVCSTIVNTIKKTISNIIGIIRKLNTLLNKSINLIINGFRGAFNTIRRLLTLFGNFGNRIKTVSHNGNILKGTFTELKSKIDLLVGAFRSLFNNEFLQNGMKLLSSVQTLNMLIGKDLTAKTIDWANNLEKGFGLSASGLIQNLQAVSSVLYGMGMSSENVYNAGRNLEALGMTMSSITGLDFDTVISKIDSGMKGMTQSIDDLGLSVRESQMDAFLQKLKAQGGEYANIGTKFANLTENQRVYVRYAAIMDQFMSKEAFSAESYARSLNTLTGQMSILKQQVQQLKSTIGLLAIKLFAQIVKPLTYIVYLANLAVKKIAALFGIDLETSNAINELGGSGIDTSGVDGLTDSLNETADAAEDAKGGLSALDHITSLNTSSSKGAGADAFDYSKLANYNDNYADMLEELGKMNDDYIEQCRQALIQMLKDMEKRVGDWFKRLTGRVIDWDVVEKNFGRSWKNIKNTFKNLKEIFKNVFDTIGGLFGSVLDDLDFSTLFEKFTRLISYLTKLGAIITKRLQPYIQKFYDDYLSPYVVKFGDWLEEHLDKWIHKTEEWLGGWESHKYDNDIKNYFEKTLPEKFNKFVESIQNAKDRITEIKNFIKGGDTDKTFIDVIKEKYEFLRDNVLTPVKDILHDLKIQLFDKNGDGDVNLEDTKISLKEIKDKIEEIGDYLSKHKEGIATLLASAVTFIVELGKIKLTIFEELFKFLVDHADTIKAVCDAVVNLINFAIKHPILTLAVAADLSIKTALAKAGIDIVFNYFKDYFRNEALIKLMGLGKNGEVAKAGKEAVEEISKVSSKKIDAACSELETKIISTVKSIKLPALVLAIAFGWGALESLKTGFEDIVGKDGKKLLNVGAWNTLANDELQKIADNFYKVLRKTYGTEIPKAEIDNALAAARSELERTGKYTAENINLMMSIIEEDLYEDIEHPIRNLANTGDFAAIANNVKVVDDAVSESSGNMASSFDNISGSTDNSVSSLDNLIGTYDELNGSSGAVVENNNNVKMSLDELVNANSAAAQSAQEHKDTVSELREQINKDLSEIGKVSESTKSRIDNMARSMGADFYSIRLSVSNVTNTVSRLHQALMNLTSRQWKVDFRDGTSTSNVRWASDSGSRIGIKGFGYANGGVPKSGSLFFANENGNPELVGNFGGYTGVANQDMIIQAIKEAAVQNSNGTGTVINNNFNIGNMLGTDADFRKLVSKVTQVQRQQNYNIANGSFAMT